jgi:orotidine-5'-phosphate decarboxylase
LPAAPFADRLLASQSSRGGPLCVGLDPRLSDLPPEALAGISDAASAARAFARFCAALLDGVSQVACAVKPQSAFFEQLGSAGVQALAATVDRAREHALPVILDVKRGDIGSTMEAYVATAVGRAGPRGEVDTVLGADAMTASPYLGMDALEPLFESCDVLGKGAFVLVRTTNPGSGALQQLLLADGRTVADAVADAVAAAGSDRLGPSGYASVGAVVALTHPQHARQLRARMPHALLLVPGLGAQGGEPRDLPALTGPDGRGFVVNASRAVSGGWRDQRHGGWEERVRIGASNRSRQLVQDVRTAFEIKGDWPW